MKEHYFLTITSYSVKHNNFQKDQFDTPNKHEIARLLITYTPKKGYEVANINIDRFTGQGERDTAHVDQLELDI